ncbi:MAG: glycosyltransferase family 2 protein [Solirubrobacteraceae bacterium]|nr:glycosyltransferase family 2 protein [Solirubrobacteraceae bacterium]
MYSTTPPDNSTDGRLASSTSLAEVAARPNFAVEVAAQLPTSATAPSSVTVIIPAFNEANRLGQTLERVLVHPQLGDRAQIIVVDDGSKDSTARVARERLFAHPDAQVIVAAQNRGKGHAIKLGARSASGDKILFMDADLATSLSAVRPVLDRLDEVDIVIGSRELVGATVTGQSTRRAVMHRAFSAQARQLTGVTVSDAQCGFKAFRRQAAETLFPRSLVNGYTFDIEILLIARKLGMSVEEIPVQWHAVAGSKIRPLRDPLAMAADVARVRYRHRRAAAEALKVVPT